MTPTPSSLVDALIARAALHGEQPAVHFLVDGEEVRQTLTYAELDSRARGLAVVLARHVAPGSRALLLMHSGLGYVVAFYACLYARVIAVPALAPESLRTHEFNRIKAILADAQPQLVLTDEHLTRSLEEAFGSALPPVLAVDGLGLKREQGQAQDWQGQRPLADDIAFLQYTSGSTTTPKGVEVSHGNLVANENMMVRCFGMYQGDVCVSWLPLYHDMGLIGCLLLAIYSGATLVLMSPRSFVERPARWLEAISRYRGTHTGAPDFAFRLAAERVADSALAQLDLRSLRVLYSGSEPIRHDSLTAFANRFTPAGFDPKAFLPCYGLAEATLFVSGTPDTAPFVAQSFDLHALGEHRAEPGEGSLLVSSGTLWKGMQVMLVAPDSGEILPERRIGEIWTSGASVARGYWNNPQATARTFVQREGATWLRTGDLGFLDQGRLYITGRLKDVIIVRGQNLYPQDLELAVEQSVEGARKGRVTAFVVEHQGREGIGIAVEIGRSTQRKVAAAQLCAEIDRAVIDLCQESAAWIALLNPGELPKTSSGKLQRSACRQMLERAELDCYYLQRAGEQAARQGVATQGEHEALVASIWAQVLGVVQVFRDDGFFALGGTSITAVQVMGRLREQLGVSLSLAALFDAPDLAAFALRVQDAVPQVGHTPLLEADPAAPAILSYAQQRLWFAWQLDPQSSVYNVPLALRLRGPLEAPALSGAFADLQARHPILRTTFSQGAVDAQFNVRSDLGLSFKVESLMNLPSPQREIAAREQAAIEAQLPFDLAAGPVQRIRLLQLDERDHVLLLTTHHIAVDGWSMQILVTELEQLYAARLTGTSVVLPTLHIGYGDFARWQRDALVGSEHSRQLDYWRTALGGADNWLELNPDRPRRSGVVAVSQHFNFAAGQTSALRTFAAERGVTPFMLLLGVFAIVLREQSGQSRIRLGSDIANRAHPRIEPLVGFFINQLVLQVDLDQQADAQALLEQCRRVVVQAADHQDLPFEQLVEALRPPRRAGRSPFFSIKLNYQEGEPPMPRLRDVRIEPFDAPHQAAELDVILGFYSSAGRLQARFETPEGLFEPTQVTLLFNQLQGVLACWLADPTTSQSALLDAAIQVRRAAEREANQQRHRLLGDQRPLRRRAGGAATTLETVGGAS
jgi:acyl-CoA synthetase (AMP-forming)/AMP-acid ligase II